MASAPGPPPSNRELGRPGVASVRLRRTSIKNGGSSAASTLSSASNQEAGNGGGRPVAQTAGARHKSQREQLFIFHRPQREQLESSLTISALQENLSALTAVNRREKAQSTSLRDEVDRLTEALAQLNGILEQVMKVYEVTLTTVTVNVETRKAEKVEQEKNGILLKQRTVRDAEDRFLPDIHGRSMAPAAALQHTQMEVTYQRKVLSLENRCVHMTENNKKLLAKIQQLENCQTETEAQLGALRQDNARLSTETENLNGTINSQSALIIGLRSTVHRLNKDEKLVENLRSALERCQRELETVKKREKLLQEEHAKLKAASSQEKEAMMSKILGFQRHLQRSDTAGGNVEALEMKVKTLLKEKAALEVDLETSNSRCTDLQTRVTQLDTLSEEFVQVKRTMEKERADVEGVLKNTQQELEVWMHKQKETELRAQEAEARNAGMQELADLVQTRDEEIATLMQKSMRLEDDIEERDQRNSSLQDEVHKLNTELQGIKQLSHDETVQALQMARQKAATYEALTLLNEEKKALEEQLRLVQERLEAELVALRNEKDAKEHLLAALDGHALTIEGLRKEHEVLLEQIESSRAAEKAAMESTTQTDEELISPETHAQIASELEETTRELGELQDELENLQQEVEDLRHDQEQKELGHKKTVSRERYKSESFQSQLKLLQNENSELSDKLESLLKDLAREQHFNDAQTLELTELKQRVLSREAIYLLRKTQDSLEQTVNSLLEAEHASESTFTCLQCMQLFTQPMTLAPCGHTYCATCLAKCGNVAEPSSISCKMCEAGIKTETECIFPNYALADLTARFIFRQQSLASLTTMCLALRNSFTQRSPNSNSTAIVPGIET